MRELQTVQYTLQTRVTDLTAPWVKSKFMVLATMLRRHGHPTAIFSDSRAAGKAKDQFMGETG